MTVAKDVVQFLMDMLGDRQAARDFLEDPEGVLEKHGLGGVSSADVDAAMPVVLDYAPLNASASHVSTDFNAGGNNAFTGHTGGWTPLPDGGGHGPAVEQLANVVSNYSYSSTPDDRATFADQSGTPNIWADGDVEQWFDNDSMPAFGETALAGGDRTGFADTRIDDFFVVDVNAGADNAGQAASPANASMEPVSGDISPYIDVDAPEGGLEFTQDDPVTIDIDNDIDDAGAEGAADYLDFGSL